VWAELRKLLSAHDPSRALLWMRQSGVLSRVLPESEKWGIDFVHGLVRAEGDLGWPADPILRLMSMVPPDPARMTAMAERLRMSTAQMVRLRKWAEAALPPPDAPDEDLGKRIYRGDRQAIIDRLRLALAGARVRGVDDDAALVEAAGYARLLDAAAKWKSPAFPLRGGDLVLAGVPNGPAVGRLFRALQDEWVESGFALDRDALLARAASRPRPD
jgi:poly(A) polymerase